MGIQVSKGKVLTTFALVMLITVAIDNIRNLPAMALFGTSFIFFFIFAAIVFLIPAALISAELSSTWTEQGGIYAWVRTAFGEHWGFLAIWLQWINTMVWYPTILSFIAATFAFLFDPQLAQSKSYLITMILTIFWCLTLMNLWGIRISAKFASLCGIFGMLIPMSLIILMGILWVATGHPRQIHFSWYNILPHNLHEGSWISLTAIMTAFLGLELATVHVNDVKNPQHAFPRALLISVFIIIITIVCGALAIAVVMPNQQIQLVDGVIQEFSLLFGAFGMHWILPLIVVMIVAGSLGGMVNWIISPAKGLLQAANHGFLPEFFRKQNKHGVASNLLLTQAVLVTLMCSAFLLVPSVNGSYWLLTDLSTELYMIMYGLMFIAAFYLKIKYADKARGFKIPGGKLGYWFTCFLGFIGSMITLVVGFFPPSSINVGGEMHYEIIFSSGIIIMILPVMLFYFYRWKNT